MENVTLRNARVLVLGYPELADAVCVALRRLAGAECTLAGVNSEHGHTTSPRAAPTTETSLRWLCERVFSTTDLTQPSRQPVSSGTHRHGPRRSWSSDSTPFQPTGLFEWGWYDFVIIQDLWLKEQRADDSGESLEAGGQILASLDYYTRGNFITRKVVLLTDPLFACWKGTGPKETRPSDSCQALKKTFDEKNVLEFVHISGGDDDPVRRLCDLLRSHQPRQNHAPAGQRLTNVAELQNPVLKTAVAALQEYITAHAQVVMIDDETADLQAIYKAITGVDLSTGQATPVSTAPSVKMVSSMDQPGRTPQAWFDFDKIVAACKSKLREASNSRSRHVIFITDILFNLPNWNKTGIDLIEALRKDRELASGKLTNRMSIVACTSFTTPLIIMSAYQRGADFVVQKVDSTQLTGHGGVAEKEPYHFRLLLTLAFLCFQKQLLAQSREECEAVSARNALRRLRTSLPPHYVSLHRQEEWHDANYYLEALSLYESGSPELAQIRTELEAKYGDAE